FSPFYGSGDNPLDDGSIGPKNIGFVFPFFDTTFNRLFIGINGGISFTDTNLNVNGYFSDLDIPGAPFGTFIAPFWNDLIFDTLLAPDAGIYLYNDPSYDTLVIEWYHPANFNDQNDTTLDFELLLTRDGSIVFQYLNVGSSNLEETALTGISELECRVLCYYNGDNPTHMSGDSTNVMITYADRTWTMSGDIDGSGNLDVADLIYLVNFMFYSGPEPLPYEAGNVNCIGDMINISDLIYLTNYMFLQGPEPCYFMLYH
ncbi:MAG: hypothetical protein U9R56_06300, partial [candidate division Zixibacteria bacterium]|nr:hypothetical protein [candidate division Zixibacteria bacterium]